MSDPGDDMFDHLDYPKHFGKGRPDWRAIMKDCGGATNDANDLVTITRETARLAARALNATNARDYYHNNGAAERELLDAISSGGTASANVETAKFSDQSNLD